MQPQLLINRSIFRRLFLFQWARSERGPNLRLTRAAMGGSYRAGHPPVFMSFHPESPTLV